jgi:hypothetical protein
MSDSERYEPEVEVRDTSWVTGELAMDFDNFPQQINRIEIDGRYNLTTPEELSRLIDRDLLRNRSYRYGAFDCKEPALTLSRRASDRWGVNSIGVVIDSSLTPQYNVVVYEDGSTEILNPRDEQIVPTGSTPANHEAYTMERGIIVL